MCQKSFETKLLALIRSKDQILLIIQNLNKLSRYVINGARTVIQICWALHNLQSGRFPFYIFGTKLGNSF